MLRAVALAGNRLTTVGQACHSRRVGAISTVLLSTNYSQVEDGDVTDFIKETGAKPSILNVTI